MSTFKIQFRGYESIFDERCPMALQGYLSTSEYAAIIDDLNEITRKNVKYKRYAQWTLGIGITVLIFLMLTWWMCAEFILELSSAAKFFTVISIPAVGLFIAFGLMMLLHFSQESLIDQVERELERKNEEFFSKKGLRGVVTKIPLRNNMKKFSLRISCIEVFKIPHHQNVLPSYQQVAQDDEPLIGQSTNKNKIPHEDINS